MCTLRLTPSTTVLGEFAAHLYGKAKQVLVHGMATTVLCQDQKRIHGVYKISHKSGMRDLL